MAITAALLDRQQFAGLYETSMTEDFEGHGLKPLAMMQQMMDQGTYECLGMYEDGQQRGYACLVREPDSGYFLLDYFAVSSGCRDKGYGGKFLETLREYYAGEKGIFLESESVCGAPDEAEQQVCMRRIRFYRRHGCRHTEVKSRLFGIEYDIFYIPLTEAVPDTEMEVDRIYRLMGLGKLYGGKVRLWKRRNRLLSVYAWEDAPAANPGKCGAGQQPGSGGEAVCPGECGAGQQPGSGGEAACPGECGAGQQPGAWAEQPSLVRALMPSGSLPAVISLVGAGGKTTTMYQLADELAEQGKRVLVTTSTHIRRPREGEGQWARIGHIREVKDISWEGNILTVGKYTGPQSGSAGADLEGDAIPGNSPADGGKAGSTPVSGKLAMPDGLGDPEAMEELMSLVDVVLIEADGARLLPAKIPEAWEPVIIPQTGMVIACAGLSALGQTFGNACFRFGTAGGWLRRRPEDVMEPEDLALILMDERGSRRQVAGRYYRIVLNQMDGRGQAEQAAQVLAALPGTMQSGCVATAYRISQEKGHREP